MDNTCLSIKGNLTLPFLSYHEADFLTVDEALHPITSFLNFVLEMGLLVGYDVQSGAHDPLLIAS